MADQNGLYFTMAYGILDTRTLEFRHSEAGHPQIVHVSAGGGAPQLIERARVWRSVGFPISTAPSIVQLKAGDRLYLYSDGVPEAMDPELNQFGNRQLLELIELGQTQPLDNSVSLLLEGVERWPEG